MGKNNTRILRQFAVLAMVLTAAIMVKEVTSLTVCKIDTNDMQKCRPAVTGNNPPHPVNECCVVVRSADLGCFCRFKFYLPILGIDPSKVTALVAKCQQSLLVAELEELSLRHISMVVHEFDLI